ncbi:apicoplast conserved ycf19 protein precursor, unknown function [Babesia microti strain RI]|uniref:YggT family protein n=1 Tax=Babesia microti (strain RI) TaxID=1133968 RepID=A0A1N6LXI9_BABMR|nr:apicoplast conserved ycf19 protein precursor, unknown function [Babesia microti strain RI]SIO73581.1 apicoplast conserved ycf19 protein precursor, unknown function [Babesia microti strain RI]|eukprot:XP_021337667.1 apicoplast conserved ycf19 protein precursor, unknown function [Babesia microti strain RI]
MLYLRYILEWLPQVNPYLPPFCTIFTATNNFIGFFQKICPPIMGFDFSGFAVWVFLENIEFILLHILSNY